MKILNNRYKIIASIKEDLSNSVFLAADMLHDNRNVALKIIYQESVPVKSLDFLKREIGFLTSMAHPNIMNIYGFEALNTIDGNNISAKQYICTYEYIKGRSIFNATTGMGFIEVMDLVVEVCYALDYLHSRGLAYKNLDEKSIIVSENGGITSVKLTGFAGNEDLERALFKGRKNSPFYKAPEVIKNDDAGALSDMYSLGVLIFCLISRKNMNRNNFYDTWSKYKSLLQNVNSIYDGIDNERFVELVDRLASDKPENRYQNVHEVVRAIGKLCDKNYPLFQKKYLEKLTSATRLIGREKNMNQLFKWKDEIFNNNSNRRIECISGEAGIGKTRLLNEFSFYMELDRVKILRGMSYENNGKKYEPILQILKQLLPLAPVEILEKYKPELVKVLPDERIIKGVIPKADLSEDKEKLRLKVRIASFILNVIEVWPSIIIIDNAQWMDDSTIELIDYIISTAKTGQFGFILSFRNQELKKKKLLSSFMNKWATLDIVNEMSLTRFDFEETGELIKSTLGMKNYPTAFCTEIFRYTEGNPGFIIDVITALFKERKLYLDENGLWSTDFDDESDYSGLYIPSNMHEAVWKHINALSPYLYMILEMLSAFDTPVSFEVIEKMVNGDRERTRDALIELMSHQIIEQRLGDWGYAYDFHSRSIKSDVYNRISSARKVQYHRNASIILEQRFKEEERINKDELIYHLIRCEEKERALALMVEAADRMLKLHINNQALAYLKKAHVIAQETSSIRDIIKIQFMMGELYRRKGENRKAFECYNVVLKLAMEVDDKHTIAKANEMIGALYTRKNDFDRALSFLNESLKISRECEFVEGYLEAVRRICWVYIYKRKNREAIGIINKVIEEYADDRYNYYKAELYNVLGTHYLEYSKVEEALECYGKSIELFESNGEKVEIAYPLNNIATVFAEFLHDNKKAREYFEKSLEINLASNLVEGISSCYDNLGETCRLEDDYAKAIEYYFKCEEQAIEGELYSLLFSVYKNIVLAYLELDEYQKSYEYLQKCKSEIECNPERGIDFQLFCEYAAHFYYEMGSYKEASDYAQMAANSSKKADIQESIKCKSIAMMSDYALLDCDSSESKATLVNGMQSMLAMYQNTNMIKDRREVLHRFAGFMIEIGEMERASILMDESFKLSSDINTKRLEIEFLYIKGMLTGGIEGIKLIEKAMEINREYKSLRLEWKCYKAMGDIYYSNRDSSSATTYYIKALDILYKIVLKVPKEYQKLFLCTHKRYVPRERLLTIKVNNLKEQELLIERKLIKPLSCDDNYLVQFFFNSIYNETIVSDSKNNGIHDFENTNDIMKRVLTQISNEYEKNMELIIGAACELTSAELGYVLQYNDKNELEVVAMSKNGADNGYYQYLIEHSNLKRSGFFASDIFGRKSGDASIVLPQDVTGVMCIPICNNKSNKKNVLSKRKNIEKSTANIKGYLYLSTSSVLNNFTVQNFELCKILSGQAFLHMENYALKIISSIDKLTGVYTRKYFESVIDQIINNAHSEKSPLSLIMIDIDKFKSINDNFGHQKGDEILSNVGRILMENIRSADVCCRYGGEEFVIILPDTSINEAEAVAEKLRSAIEKERLMGQGNNLTVSLGVSSYPKHGEWRDELIGKADQALYYAKESGRNRSCVWNTRMRKLTNRMDKLAGIITGNVVQDQRNVLAMLEIIQLVNENIGLSDKIYKILGVIMEIFDSEYGMLLTVSGVNNGIGNVYTRKRSVLGWQDGENYSRKIVEKVVKTNSGVYIVDWDDIEIIDSETGEPVFNSILAEPIIKKKSIRGILYLSCPISRKEYGFSELNFLGVIGNMLSGIITHKAD
ncbi:diguanylate cyclase [Acetivibrio cellulolyticus]|uniref:diguanylate cyclase n=1 Tax=Acetivibrio cellulolyticus TaxID=35830 RepID=UPI0001E2DE50|nr:diguanylate cyclase [Acetivibrio cellulolyticus]